MADIRELHARSVEDFAALVEGVPPDAWGRPTPCSEWDVRALVNHVVGEERWVPPLLDGATIAEVGDRFDGDLLGDDPVSSAGDAAKGAIAGFAPDDAMERTVHLSFGDTPASEYAWQLFADHLVHGWDLAVASGQQPRLPDDAVDALAQWFDEREDMYRGGGAIAERADVAADAPAADRLLARFGRDPGWSAS
jgi:uncharacterized protein (TIGR03086 family)